MTMSDYLEITHEALEVGKVTELVTAPNTGAVSLFIGTTRDHFEGQKVAKLEYEAYVPMAKKELQKVCDKIRANWDVHNIAIYHRLGIVKVTEASVIIAVTSEHRKNSLKAVQFAIDDLKARVPIWKKEIYENSSSEWKKNKECLWSQNEIKQEIPDETDDEIQIDADDVKIEADDVKIDDEDVKIDAVEIDPNEIQITASNEEIMRRMESFMQRKRDEINSANVLEFCNRHVSDEPEFSCARTDSILVRKKGKFAMAAPITAPKQTETRLLSIMRQVVEM